MKELFLDILVDHIERNPGIKKSLLHLILEVVFQSVQSV